MSFLIPLIPYKQHSTLHPESTYFPANLIILFSPLKTTDVFLKLLGENANSVTRHTIVCLFWWLLNSLVSSDKPSSHHPKRSSSKLGFPLPWLSPSLMPVCSFLLFCLLGFLPLGFSCIFPLVIYSNSPPLPPAIIQKGVWQMVVTH